MARTIYFLDGTREVLLIEDNDRTELGRIIRERLGTDAETLYQEIIEANIALEDELKSYESSLETYHALLTDIRDHLLAVMEITGTLNNKKAPQTIRDIIQSINNHL
jgi:hypothetical protein